MFSYIVLNYFIINQIIIDSTQHMSPVPQEHDLKPTTTVLGGCYNHAKVRDKEDQCSGAGT